MLIEWYGNGSKGVLQKQVELPEATAMEIVPLEGSRCAERRGIWTLNSDRLDLIPGSATYPSALGKARY